MSTTPAAPLPAELIRATRDRRRLSDAQIGAVVAGIARGTWSDAQVGAWAMAACLNGLDDAETAALTLAMRDSGDVLRWDAAALGGPVLDKHSTGGVGDKVSLMLAPLLAACGAFVPMVSGRGLGHTGGTLDKLDAIPGYDARPSLERFQRTVREVGCAIVGATDTLAPADRRLYAIRDVTATVESVPLITASILSKKLAAGLHGLVMDVKVGSGAFMPTRDAAMALATSIVRVAGLAGLPCRALLTDMNAVLGTTAGNALEVREAIDWIKGDHADARLTEVVCALAAEALVLGRLAADRDDARRRIDAAWRSGAAAERFARMVHALGGPADLLDAPDRHLPAAPVRRAVPAPATGVLAACDVRAVGLALVALSAGRRTAGDAVDPRVGLADVRPPGTPVSRGDALAWVHAADDAAADAAVAALMRCWTVAPLASDRPGSAAAPWDASPIVAAVGDGPAHATTTTAPTPAHR